jgi:NAD(P)-dependent dehydrogenase (short-subunit alcohol dehydrogenase family)
MLPGIKQFDLTDRAAIVTGGSKGLGQAMAAGLASAGADVLLVSRNLDEAQSAAKDIASDHGRQAVGFQADVTQEAEVDAMMAKSLGAAGHDGGSIS